MSDYDPTSQPNSGRIVDYWLGGFNNFEVDRLAAGHVVKQSPDAPQVAMAQRRFLRRAVAFVAQQGVKSFLDFGSGLPTVGNTHEVVKYYHPDGMIVYSDIDPVTVNQGKELVRDLPGVSFVTADGRDPEKIFQAPEVQALRASNQPVGIVAVGLFHFLTDANIQALLGALYRWAPIGSYVVISQTTTDFMDRLGPEALQKAKEINEVYARSGTPLYARSRDELGQVVAPWTITEDGIRLLEEWRPDPEEPSIFEGEEWHAHIYCLVATKTKAEAAI